MKKNHKHRAFSTAESQKKKSLSVKIRHFKQNINCHEYDVLAEGIKLLSRQAGDIKGTGNTGEKFIFK